MTSSVDSATCSTPERRSRRGPSPRVRSRGSHSTRRCHIDASRRDGVSPCWLLLPCSSPLGYRRLLSAIRASQPRQRHLRWAVPLPHPPPPALHRRQVPGPARPQTPPASPQEPSPPA